MTLKMFNVRIPSDLIMQIRKYSKESGLKIWRIVADALSKYFEEAKK